MMGVKLAGTGSALPTRVVTNDDLARIVDTSDEWISTRTGIRSRRYLAEGESHRQLARDAAERALAAAGIAPEQVGVCLVATFTAPLSTPSAACLVQRDLGLPEDTLCLDLNAACAGFVYGLHVAECLLADAATRPYALVVGVDTVSRVLDFTDRSTCVLFGDGAGAAVLERGEGYPGLSAAWGARGDDEPLSATGVGAGKEAGPAFLHMDGRAVFRFATEVLPRCTQDVLARAGVAAEDVDRYVFHQANSRIVDLAVRKLGVDPARCRGNIAHTGNTSAASVPILLDELVRAGDLASGQRALCVGFGAGLTWAGVLLQVK